MIKKKTPKLRNDDNVTSNRNNNKEKIYFLKEQNGNSDLKSSVIERRNSLVGLNSRLELAEERVGRFDHIRIYMIGSK